MRLIAAAGLAGALLATSPVYAADLFGSAPPPMPEPVEGQTELGSNWYIRGDVGRGQTKQETLQVDSRLFPNPEGALNQAGYQPIGNPGTPLSGMRGNQQTATNLDFGAGFGYRVNDWFRVEADGMFSRGPGLGVKKTVYCPEDAITNPAGLGSGYLYDYTTCDGNLSVYQRNITALAMGYVDLGHYSIFTPYVGLGGGVNVNTIRGDLTFTQTSDGAAYAGTPVKDAAQGAYWVLADGSSPTGKQIQPIGPANWHRTINQTRFSFAAAAAAGLGIQISQSATLDIGYKVMSLDVTSGVKGMRQAINLGVRYNLN